MKIYGDEKTFKDKWASIQDRPLKFRLEYLFQYYGIPALIVIAVLAIGISMTVSIIKNRIPKVIQAEMITAVVGENAEANMKEYLCKELGLDESKYNIEISSLHLDSAEVEALSYQTQKISARITAKDLDVLGADKSTFSMFMSKEDRTSNGFCDLSEVLPKELFDRLNSEGRILYFEAEYGNIPYLVDPTGTELVKMLELKGIECNLGIAVTAQHMDAAVKMFELIR